MNNRGQHIEQRLIITSQIEAQNSQDQVYYEGQEMMTQHLQQKFQQMTKQINEMPRNPDLFKNHQLPLARIKKIMKSDEDMISSQTPVLFAKACQIFIIELTHRAWKFTEESKRRTLQKSDIAACIEKTEIFDFLIDLIPKEEQRGVSNGKKPEEKMPMPGPDWKYSNTKEK